MFKRRGFTLIELIVSVTLLIIAISIALFATVGVGGLIQKTDARGVVSESARSVSDEIRSIVGDVPVGAVSLLEPNADGKTFAAIRVKAFSSTPSNNICTVVGRSIVSLEGGEEQYTINKSGTVVALKIYSVDAGGLCPLVTSKPYYQNRLIDTQSIAKDLSFYLQNIPCQTQTASCVTKQLLRFAVTVELSQKTAGTVAETRQPTVTLQDGLPIGLVNESSAALNIDTTALAAGTTGTAYTDTVTASGGSPAYTWSIVAGSLPPGNPAFNLNASTGVITGTPTAVGTFNFTVKVIDASNTAVTRPLSITISAGAGPLTVTTLILSPPSASESTPYSSAPIQASGGTQPYTWSLIGAPAWLAIGASSAVISGTPPPGSSAGSPYTFTVKVTDAAANTATKLLTLTVGLGGLHGF